jgi:hypothetical protein
MSLVTRLVAGLRRRRALMARLLTPFRAELLQFLVFAAVALALTGPFVFSHTWDVRAPAGVLAAFVLAYLVLDVRRPADAEPRKRDDMIALGLYLVLPFAVLAAAWLTQQSAAVSGPLAIPENPPPAISATIVP